MVQLTAEDQVINAQLAGAAERALALATIALMDARAPDDALAWFELYVGLSGLQLRDGQPRGDFGGLLAPAHDDKLDRLMLQVIDNLDGLANSLANEAGEELIRGRMQLRTREEREPLLDSGQLGEHLDPVGARVCLLRRREVMKARADLKRVWAPR
jgi:hypothetical protein